GGVEDRGLDALADPLRRRRQLVVIARRDGDLGARVRRQLRRALAHAGRAAHHQNLFAVERAHASHPLFLDRWRLVAERRRATLAFLAFPTRNRPVLCRTGFELASLSGHFWLFSARKLGSFWDVTFDKLQPISVGSIN